MSGLKQKLAFSYGLLIIVIFAVSAWSIYHMVTLGRAIDVILINNYKSILAAENMKEALERQDSSALFPEVPAWLGKTGFQVAILHQKIAGPRADENGAGSNGR